VLYIHEKFTFKSIGIVKGKKEKKKNVHDKKVDSKL
jgi:hypothetical protein